MTEDEGEIPELHSGGSSFCHHASVSSASADEIGMRSRKTTATGSSDTRGGGVLGTSSPNEDLREREYGSFDSGESMERLDSSSGVDATGSVGKGAERKDDFRLRIGPVPGVAEGASSTARRERSAISQGFC